MSSNYKTDVLMYYSSMLQARKMLDLQLISLEDYKQIEELIANKYCIKDISIYRLNDLIDPSLLGNIIPEKGD